MHEGRAGGSVEVFGANQEESESICRTNLACRHRRGHQRSHEALSGVICRIAPPYDPVQKLLQTYCLSKLNSMSMISSCYFEFYHNFVVLIISQPRNYHQLLASLFSFQPYY